MSFNLRMKKTSKEKVMGKKTGSYKKKVYGGYDSKKKKGNGMKKIVSGVLFAAACFVAVFVLLEFHDVYWIVGVACLLLMAAAYFFLNEIFASKEDVFDDLIQAQEALEEVKEEDRQRAEEEFKKQIAEQVQSLDRTSRAMFAAMKKSADAQEEHLAVMQDKIDKVIDEQNAGIKTIVKYNKENARQIAESEKEVLDDVLNSVKNVECGIDDLNGSLPKLQQTIESVAEKAATAAPQVVMAAPMYPAPGMAAPAYTAPAPMPAAVPVEEPAAEEPLIDISNLDIPEEPIAEAAAEEPALEIPDIEIPEEPAAEEAVAEEPALEIPDIEIPEEPAAEEVAEEPALEIPDIEIPEEPAADEAAAEPVAEETPAEEAEAPAKKKGGRKKAAEEPASEADLAAATGVDLSDPNAALSADDIAKLFAAANSNDAPAAEPEPEPAPASEADLAAATGVDLSDPNAALSADDIAKLFAAANGGDAPAPDPEPEPASEADLAAATGVDLSDPNAALSPDDIAKLFAAAGN